MNETESDVKTRNEQLLQATGLPANDFRLEAINQLLDDTNEQLHERRGAPNSQGIGHGAASNGANIGGGVRPSSKQVPGIGGGAVVPPKQVNPAEIGDGVSIQKQPPVGSGAAVLENGKHDTASTMVSPLTAFKIIEKIIHNYPFFDDPESYYVENQYPADDAKSDV